MFKCVAGWFRARAPQQPFFEAFQIEVTSRCLTRCTMCPRVALAGEWREQDLPWEGFQRIAKAFCQTRHVHLQGWGEPLLHPRIFDMINVAKAAGCRVGLTTNGMGLDAAARTRLMDAGLDLVAISIAGASRKMHESIRVGSDFTLIVDNIRELLGLRADRRAKAPKVEISFLMTKANVPELPDAVRLAASLGVDELYATNLDYAITPAQDAARVFGDPERAASVDRIVDAAEAEAERAGLRFRSYPTHPAEVAVCEANPLRILFISSDGSVCPCPYLGLAGRADIPRRFEGQALSVERPRFGTVLEQDLTEIWKSRAYRAFRRKFERRLGHATMTAVVGDATDLAAPFPPPDPCVTCYKLYGV